MHKEFVVLMKDGSRDWVDPVSDEDSIRLDSKEIHVINSHTGYVYSYPLDKIEKWVIREYSPDTTYDPI